MKGGGGAFGGGSQGDGHSAANEEGPGKHTACDGNGRGARGRGGAEQQQRGAGQWEDGAHGVDSIACGAVCTTAC